MSHQTRVEHHIVVDILAGVLGASFVTALTARSLLALLLAALSGVVLFLLERNNIQEEDKLETNSDFFPETVTRLIPVPSLSDKDVAILKKKALHPASTVIPTEGLAFYMAGLEDGAAVTSQWVLNQIEDSE